ncbi:flagellar basal body rod protein FlgB [Sulfurimonas sp.]|uniref:flagellar basal body rod protein FlgB n=1 Tax=Sulfurimonas sp. TaxID=2022749 RepID=UPI00286D9148|nr:flagellar basal body rod protein FlgB [Sulfurimonas sp.]
MSIEVSATHALAAKALDYRAIRQDMISSNIANADTPFYKPRDISFDNALAVEKAKILNQNSPKLEMAQTNGAHIAFKEVSDSKLPTTYFRDGHMARNDGNSVDLDVETTEMSKNSIMFSALVSALKKDSAIFTNVIDASSKIS